MCESIAVKGMLSASYSRSPSPPVRTSDGRTRSCGDGEKGEAGGSALGHGGLRLFGRLLVRLDLDVDLDVVTDDGDSAGYPVFLPADGKRHFKARLFRLSHLPESEVFDGRAN